MCFGQGGFLSGNNLCTMQYVCTGSETRRNKLCKDETLQIIFQKCQFEGSHLLPHCWREVASDKTWLCCSAPKVQEEQAQTKHTIVRRSAETRKVISSPCRPASILLIIKRKNQTLPAVINGSNQV